MSKPKDYKNLFEDFKNDGETCIHRYKSWNIVFEDFKDLSQNSDSDKLARSLWIYLASWGMLRGSSKLLTKYNYKIHIPLIDELKNDKEFCGLRDYPKKEKDDISEYVKKVISIKEKIEKFYTGKLTTLESNEIYSKYKDTKPEDKVSPSQTLVSKILLGVSGCMPAYDQYFKLWLNDLDILKTINKCSLTKIWELWFDEIKGKINSETYPPMKVVDMVGFQYGLEKTEKEKEGKEKQKKGKSLYRITTDQVVAWVREDRDK